MSLLRDLQENAVQEASSVTVLLRQCLVLAARLDHEPLRDWAQLELNGYPSDATLPPYRPTFKTQVLGDFSGPFGSGLRNGGLAEGAVPDELSWIRDALFSSEVRQGVAEIERLVESGETSLSVPWPMDVVALVQDRFMEGMNLT